MAASLDGKDHLFTDYLIQYSFDEAIESKLRNTICDQFKVTGI